VSAASRLGPAFASSSRTGLIPYLTAGYPSPDQTFDMACGLAARGALALEIGIPFSDPIADGPDIQRASEWAMRSGVGVPETLAIVKRLRGASGIPVVIMTYANPVLRHGAARFASEAREAGVDGVLLSDLPPEELPEVWRALDDAGLDTVLLVAPTTADARIPALAARSRGFVYCLSRTGVTGGGGGEAVPIAERVAALRRFTHLPIAVGFGISTRDQARALSGVADAVVVGAAFMRAVTEDPARGAVERVVSLGADLLGALETDSNVTR
jgi:tryptophan synthase alpha chain